MGSAWKLGQDAAVAGMAADCLKAIALQPRDANGIPDVLETLRGSESSKNAAAAESLGYVSIEASIDGYREFVRVTSTGLAMIQERERRVALRQKRAERRSQRIQAVTARVRRVFSGLE